MKRLLLAAVLAVSSPVLAACGGKEPASGPAPEFSTVVSPTATAPSAVPTTAAARPPSAAPPAASWPSPEDCVTYDPATVWSNYAAGIHSIRAGSTELLRLSGGPDEPHGAQAVAVAKRYRKLCFIGRGNTREDSGDYVFEYWRNSSGDRPPVPDENCSNYDRRNLTVEDMGGGHGWRVKDDDNVLQWFDTESDARDGRLVLAKYSRICFIGRGDDGEGKVTY